MPHHPVGPRNRSNMRHALTPAELKLWNAVRAHRLMGLGFRRQHPIDRFIVDFACPERRLIVELDGSGHGDECQVIRDDARTRTLEVLGWTVLRFWNDEVLGDLDGVCRHIVISAGLGVPNSVLGGGD